MEPQDHLFRQESGRMVAALTRIFGVHNLALAEDVVQEAFCRAIGVWRIRGMPENPSAWLMATAKNCALDALRREHTARTFAPDVALLLQSEWTHSPVLEEFFSPNAIKDDQLRMMFSCCHPGLPEESQIALILNILCGFSAAEIAAAFVSSHAALEKRITRAKRTLATSKRLFDMEPPTDFSARLPAVQSALYLLFNEGYHGASSRFAIRADLCHEAIRLVAVLLKHPLAETPASYALASLMSLNAARLPGRVDAEGNLSSFADQDRSRWDQELLGDGLRLLERSAIGSTPTEYHVEAAIAAVHATASRIEDTDWERIISLYDALMTMSPTPIVALNRAIAIAQHHGPQRGIEEMAAIENCERLSSYPFYSAALGELEARCGRFEIARKYFLAALAIARNPSERRFLARRAKSCESGDSRSAGLLPDIG